MNDDRDHELSKAIQAHATRHAAPASLRDRLAVQLHQAPPPAKAPNRPRQQSWAFWKQWAQMGGAFACGLVIASLVLVKGRMPSVDQERLEQEVVADHVRSLMATHLADVASSDQHTVKPWFSGKLDFSPPVRDLAKEGFPLIGGRLDYLNQRQVAALVYAHNRHTINVFVWPSGDGARTEAKPMSRQGFNVVDWTDAGMQFWAVSDLNTDQLQAFSRMLGAKP
jgi:anti-sigma factor RsiW